MANDSDATSDSVDSPLDDVEHVAVDVAEAPDDLSARESAALERVRTVTQLLDDAVRVPGTDFRFGLDPVLGLLPVAGDAIAAGISLYPVIEGVRLDAPKRTLAAMVGLVAIDAVIGSVPVFGTLFDAAWKANEWNRRLLERHLGQD